MSKQSIIARNIKRQKLVAKYAKKREELKKAKDYTALDKLPKNSSKVRVRNRCNITGRPKGYIRKFGISRIVFRTMAREGKIPGIRKASW